MCVPAIKFIVKEVAPLLNFGADSVEIKRYRLRKKMGLSL
jgi:hypothetical protein